MHLNCSECRESKGFAKRVAARAVLFCLVSLVGAKAGVAKEPPARLVTVVCEFPGASAKDVESLVCHPIEVALSGIPRATRVTSASRSGRATVWVEFRPGTDLFAARQSVADRLEKVAGSLPTGVLTMLATPSSGDVLLVALSAEDAAKTDEARIEQASQLRDFADFLLRPRLLAVSGVSDVSVSGGLQKRYEVLASQKQLDELDVTLSELGDAIAKANSNVADGDLIARQEVLIRGLGRSRSLQDLSEIIIVARQGRPVRVKDVAKVRIGRTNAENREGEKKEKHDRSHLDGVILAVQTMPGVSMPGVRKKVDEVLGKMKESMPENAKVEKFAGRQLDNLVATTMRDLGRKLPMGCEFRRRTTPRLGDHLVVDTKADRFAVKLLGSEVQVLRSKADDVLALMREVPGIEDLMVEPQSNIAELEAQIHGEATARFGLTRSHVAEAINMGILGQVVTQVRDGETLVDVVLKTGETVADFEAIGRLRIRTEAGPVLVRQVATIRIQSMPPVVYRENFLPVVYVLYRVHDGKVSDVQADIQSALQSVEKSLRLLGGNYLIEYHQ